MDAATAAVAVGLVAPSAEPAPVAPASPFTCVGKFQSPSPEVNALAMCSDGQHFVCGYNNGDVALWDMRKPRQRVVADLGDRSCVYSVAASANCERIMVGTETGLWLWDVGPGKVTQLGKYDRFSKDREWDVWWAAITPDGRFGVSGGDQGCLRVWDLENGELIGSKDTGGVILDVVISPDGQTAAALVAHDDSDSHRSDVWRWCAGSGFSMPVHLQGSGSHQIYAMSAAGGMVLAAHSERKVVTVQRWDLQSGEGETAFSTQAEELTGIYLSADGRRALLKDEEGCLSVWDVEGKACLATLNKVHSVSDVAISADGCYAAFSRTLDGCLSIWHLG